MVQVEFPGKLDRVFQKGTFLQKTSLNPFAQRRFRFDPQSQDLDSCGIAFMLEIGFDQEAMFLIPPPILSF